MTRRFFFFSIDLPTSPAAKKKTNQTKYGKKRDEKRMHVARQCFYFDCYSVIVLWHSTYTRIYIAVPLYFFFPKTPDDGKYSPSEPIILFAQRKSGSGLLHSSDTGPIGNKQICIVYTIILVAIARVSECFGFLFCLLLLFWLLLLCYVIIVVVGRYINDAVISARKEISGRYARCSVIRYCLLSVASWLQLKINFEMLVALRVENYPFVLCAFVSHIWPLHPGIYYYLCAGIIFD